MLKPYKIMEKLITFTVYLTFISLLLCITFIILTMFVDNKTLFDTMITTCWISIVLNSIVSLLMIWDIYSSNKK